ncbi:hypothetical protein B0H19DRAFT_1384813 [Mycena capillaripes]|nr:hypothetical protein B0H19DRAFT_1384813 [Mycena capillaripes]
MSALDLRFPNEVWLRVFSFVEANSLRAVILASKRFHNLGLQELSRTLVWNTAARAEANIQFWENNSNAPRHVPTALSMDGNKVFTYLDNESHPAILMHISWFPNLWSLSLSNACLSITFYQVLGHLPNLTHLDLVSCGLANPPPHFPYSFPGFSSEPAISVTDLSISYVESYQYKPPFDKERAHDQDYVKQYNDYCNHFEPPAILHLFSLLPHLCALTLASYTAIPISVLQQLTSFSLSAMELEDAVLLLKMYLRVTPNLLHLSVESPAERVELRREGEEPPAPPQLLVELPLLESYDGPAYIAARLMSGSPKLTSLKINAFLKKTEEAVALIEAASGAALREIELCIQEWDDEVLLAVAHRLPACEDVRVVFRFSQPSDDFLFNLGITYLPLLTHLRTLHVYAVPPLAQAKYHEMEDLGHGVAPPVKTRARAVDPNTEDCAEYLAVWKRYNLALMDVRFVEGRQWARQLVTGRWNVGNVGSA